MYLQYGSGQRGAPVFTCQAEVHSYVSILQDRYRFRPFIGVFLSDDAIRSIRKGRASEDPGTFAFMDAATGEAACRQMLYHLKAYGR